MKHPTVFVLGAGASAPYDFPLGVGLAREVRNTLYRSEIIDLFQNHLQIHPTHTRSFADALARSGRQSVDAFLEHRPEFMDVGKAGIALILIGHEHPTYLFEGRGGGWLDYMFDKLNCPFERFGANKVAFITFNYDRSLEYYLFTCLQNSYGKSAEACAHQLKQIRIIHLHGDLGALPWQQTEDVRDYEPTVSPEAVRIASRRIKIIHEDIVGRDNEFNEAKRLLHLAEQIYFFGFGYNATNMARLGIAHMRDGIARGTGHGLTDHERSLISESIQRKIQILPHDCIDLLRNVVMW